MIIEIFLTQTEEGNIVLGAMKQTLNSDIIVTDEEINDLVDTEFDHGCHDDHISDYSTFVDFYLSNITRDSYIEYIQNRLDDKSLNSEALIVIQSEVERRILKDIKEFDDVIKSVGDTPANKTNETLNIHTANTMKCYEELKDIKEKKYTIKEIKDYATSWLKHSLSSDSYFGGEPENERLSAFIYYIDKKNDKDSADSDSIDRFLKKNKKEI